MHPKDPIPDAQKIDIIYHWKFQAREVMGEDRWTGALLATPAPINNCTADYIGETNRSLKERVSHPRNQATSAIRNHHISTKHPKAEL